MSIQIDREIQNKTREATQLLQSFCMMDAVKTPVLPPRLLQFSKNQVERGGKQFGKVHAVLSTTHQFNVCFLILTVHL